MSRQRPNDSRLCWLTKTKAAIIWGLMTGVAVGIGLMLYWLMRPRYRSTLPILTRLTHEDMETEYAYRTVPLG